MIEVGQHFQSKQSARVYEVIEIDFDESVAWLQEVATPASPEVLDQKIWSCAFKTLGHPDIYEEVL
jgi:hypothetical protein